VIGCSVAIERALDTRKTGGIFTTRGEIDNVQINRSPTSYLANPPAELSQYDTDTNKEAFSFLFKNNEKAFGSFSWFGLHPTSVNFTNRLVSSDNRGYAALKLERDLGPDFIAG